VLPQAAVARINYRIDPHDTSADILARAKAATRGLPVELGWESPPREATPVSSTTSDGWKLVAALAGASTHAPVAPGLVIAGTDSRSLSGVAQDVYRFQPLVLSMDGTEMIHGTNEHMTLANLALMTEFYARLMATGAR
jgi:carboxypeptidase PM20D1